MDQTNQEWQACLIAMLAEAYVAGRLEAHGQLYIAPDQRFAQLLTEARAEARQILSETVTAPAGLAVVA